MTDADDTDPDLVQVGRTGSAHGIDGELRVFTADPYWEHFREGSTLYVETFGGLRALEIEGWRVAADFVIAKFGRVDDRNAAEELTNLEVYVDGEVMPELGDGEFYHYDLEGREVYVGGQEGEEARRIGEVEGIFETGANDVLVVRRDDGDDLYVPMFEGAIEEMEPGGDRVLLRPAEEWAPDDANI